MNIIFGSKNDKTEYRLIPVCANYTLIRRGFRSYPHIHPVYHIMFVIRGRGYFENDNGKYILNEKDVFIIHPNEKHILSSEHETGMLYFTYNFYLLPISQYRTLNIDPYSDVYDNAEVVEEIEKFAELARLDQLFDFNIDDIYFQFNKDIWDEIMTVITDFTGTSKEFYDNIIYMWQNDPFWNNRNIYNRFAKFFWDIYTIFSSSSNEASENSNKDDVLLNRIIEYLKNHLHEKYSLSDLADHLTYHPVYICTYFKQKTGMTIRDYFNKMKINQACKYLRTTDKSITEIAYSLNFSSPNHFSRNFYKEKRMSPRDYRKYTE
ncbi:MAG: AraC family transcriptional regulator [Clostridiales bacterium]|jgi:AraC-like DNA-binding protein|nr:AraC family transcriptional regulator [Clostridiales bacterium]